MEGEEHVVARWMAIGDWGEEGSELHRLAAAMAAYADARGGLHCVLACGDNFYPMGITNVSEPYSPDLDSPEFAFWRRAFLRHPQLRVPWRVVLGNHDYMGRHAGAQLAFSNSSANPSGLWQMPRRSYSFRQGSVAFFGFDATACQACVRRRNPDSLRNFEEDRAWLQQALMDERTARWKVLFMHHPLYTDGVGHAVEAHCLRQAQYGKGKVGLDFERTLNEAGGVDLVIAGHEHEMMLKRVGATLHVVCGATVESNFYMGRQPVEKREMDWVEEGVTGFLAFEVTESGRGLCDGGTQPKTSLTVQFVATAKQRIVKSITIEK